VDMAVENEVSGIAIARRARHADAFDTFTEYILGRDEVLASQRAEQQRRTATAVMERPSGVTFTLPPTVPPDEYLTLAASIGMDSPNIIKARLERYLALNGWVVYPYDRVMAYLQQLADREQLNPIVNLPDDGWTRPMPSRVVPYWAPLRKKDARSNMRKPGRTEMEPAVVAPVYERDVPKHALEKVQALERDLGEGPLAFFVSDYASVRPDPFLLVLAGDGKYVIDVWDEPGWGM